MRICDIQFLTSHLPSKIRCIIVLKGPPKCSPLVEHCCFSNALQDTPRDQFPATASYLFQPSLFTYFALHLDEIPEGSQSFAGYLSLGNNDNATQASLTSKLWALTQLKSSSLPLLVPRWAWKSTAGGETCPASSLLPLAPSSCVCSPGWLS